MLSEYTRSLVCQLVKQYRINGMISWACVMNYSKFEFTMLDSIEYLSVLLEMFLDIITLLHPFHQKLIECNEQRYLLMPF